MDIWIDNVPFIGVGLSYRVGLSSKISSLSKDIDFLEVISDHFLDNSKSLKELKEIYSRYKIIPHGINLSIGSADGLDFEYLDSLSELVKFLKPLYYSEHLSFTKISGIKIPHLTPLLFTRKQLQILQKNLKIVKQVLKVPIVLENVTNFIEIPEGDYSELEFFKELVVKADCGILLDITNVYINSVNNGSDPKKYLSKFPLKSVVQLHIAGGQWSQGILQDSHSKPVPDAVWELVEYVCKKVRVRGIIIEHDNNFLSTEIFRSQLNRARSILKSSWSVNS